MKSDQCSQCGADLGAGDTPACRCTSHSTNDSIQASLDSIRRLRMSPRSGSTMPSAGWTKHPSEILRLVIWSGDPFAVAADAVEDLVGGLGPLEGPGVVVPELDPVLERGLEVVQ